MLVGIEDFALWMDQSEIGRQMTAGDNSKKNPKDIGHERETEKECYGAKCGC